MVSTRRNFLKLGLGGIVLAGCGGADPTPAGGNCLNNGTTATIQSNHGHALTVTKADVAAKADKSYEIMGTSAHSHTVMITAAQFGTLAQNQSISVSSTTTAGHTHTVSVSCA